MRSGRLDDRTCSGFTRSCGDSCRQLTHRLPLQFTPNLSNLKASWPNNTSETDVAPWGYRWMGWVEWLDWISLGGVKYRAPTVLSKIPSEGGSLLLLVELFGNTCSPFNLIVRLISSILGTLTPACLPGKSALYKSFLLQLPR